MYTRRMACTEIDRQTSRQTDRQTDRQTNRQTDKQTDRQTNRQTIFLYLIHLYYILPLYTTLHPVSMRVTAYLHIRVHPITYHNVLPQILMCYSLFIYMLWLFPPCVYLTASIQKYRYKADFITEHIESVTDKREVRYCMT